MKQIYDKEEETRPEFKPGMKPKYKPRIEPKVRPWIRRSIVGMGSWGGGGDDGCAGGVRTRGSTYGGRVYCG